MLTCFFVTGDFQGVEFFEEEFLVKTGGKEPSIWVAGRVLGDPRGSVGSVSSLRGPLSHGISFRYPEIHYKMGPPR